MVRLIAILLKVCFYVLELDVLFGYRDYQFCIIIVEVIPLEAVLIIYYFRYL
jgi:hypothetical protein